MNRFEAWSVHASNLLVGVSGLIYAWMRYFVEPADPFSVVGHPWQPHLQHLHVWSAPLMVFAAGLIWRAHVWKHWRQGIRSGRRSGVSLALALAPMVVSGYLIQTAVEPAWRQAWIVIHLTASGLWLLGYVAHLMALLGRRRQAAANRRQSAQLSGAASL